MGNFNSNDARMIFGLSKMRVCEEVTSNIISRNFAKIMLCLRNRNNLEEKGLRQSSVMVCGISNKTDWVFSSDSSLLQFHDMLQSKSPRSKSPIYSRLLFSQHFNNKYFVWQFKTSLRPTSKGKQSNDFNAPSTIRILV